MHRHRLVLACCGSLLTAIVAAARNGTADAVVCVEGSPAAPERVIEACDALLMDKATAEAQLPAIFLARAHAFVGQGRLKLAIDDLGRVAELRPDNAGAFLKRAELNRSIGDTDTAIRDFSAALRLEPKNTSALLARAELHRGKGDRRRALADYAAVLRLEPAHEAAAASHKALAHEIERQGAMMPLQK